MQVRFSTDDLPPRDRVRFWCDYFAKQARSITPSEIPDPDTFRAEASGSAAGGFALLDIKSGLERVQRTAADVAKDKAEAFFIRRSRRPAIWRVAPGSMPFDLIHEPGDFCVSSTEWRFDAKSKGPTSFDMLVIPHAALSPLLTGGRLARPFRLPGASPLGSLLGAAMDAAKAQTPLLTDELGEAVLRNLCGLVALACGASDEGTEQGRDSLRSALLAAVKRHVDLHLADPDLPRAAPPLLLASPRAKFIGCSSRAVALSLDTFCASGCSDAATRSPGRREPADRCSTSLSAGASTVWRHSIARSQASSAARPPCSG